MPAHILPYVLTLSLAGIVAAQNGCLDQSYLPNPLTNGLEVTQNQPVTQTFTAGKSGQLTWVEISRIKHHNGICTNSLTVDIVATNAGVPTTTVLATATIPPTDIALSAPTPVLIDFRLANVFVAENDVLALALSSPNPPGTPSYAWWGEAPASGYAGGQIFIQQTISLAVWDLAFQTWVSSPATMANYGAGHPGTSGVPGLTASATPVLGTAPNLLLGNSAGAPTLGAIFFGDTPISVVTPWDGTALVFPLVSIAVVVPAGGAQVPLAIPNDPALCGFSLYMQGILVDGGASQSIAFTPGLVFVLGD
ncbi:MAG TPA: hypothetical protein VF384_18480 [Planctomycetota bacterium]